MPKSKGEEEGEGEEAEEAGPSSSSSPIDRSGIVLRAEDRTLPGFEESQGSRKWKEPFYFIQVDWPLF